MRADHSAARRFARLKHDAPGVGNLAAAYRENDAAIDELLRGKPARALLAADRRRTREKLKALLARVDFALAGLTEEP